MLIELLAKIKMMQEEGSIMQVVCLLSTYGTD